MTAGTKRLPTATWAPQNKIATIRPTLAARPSMLSSILNELVSPTTQSTVTAPPKQRVGERAEQGDSHAAHGEGDRAAELDAQAQPPVEGLPVIPEAHEHDDAGERENEAERARAKHDAAGMTGECFGKVSRSPSCA